MAAVDHGADAVYMGADRFGARAAAGNSDEDVAEVVEYAHKFGVKVYVTLNTLLRGQDELDEAVALARRMYGIGVDALIVQDERLRLAPDFPPIPLHASTQMDNRTAEKVSRLCRQGYEQVVLARELSIGEIAAIHEKVPQAVLEVFVHGAICVCYNGRCFASEVCYGRSANRGECAQFCRMPYDLETASGRVLAKGRYLLSMRDMNRTDSLEALLDAGVRSLKIEGRLKDAAYVKNVTAWYRKHLDEIFRRRREYVAASWGRVETSFVPAPEKSFNRGFTDYFLHGRTTDLCNPVTPKSMGEYVGYVKEIRRDHVVVAGTASFANGDGLCYVTGALGEEQLVGFRINRAEGNHLFPHKMPQGLKDGMRVFRNQDQHMEAQLAATPSSRRTLQVDWSLEETAVGFRLTACSEGLSAGEEWEAEHQEARTPQTASITEVLSKLGGTHFSVGNVEVTFSRQWFVPRSVLAERRRSVLGKLEMAGREKRRQNDSLMQRAGETGNVLPTRGDGGTGESPFYNPHTTPLMTCRYCIRFQLGHCLRQHAQAVKEPLFLRGADGRRFPLQFDCSRCEMKVLEDKGK